MEVLHVAPPLCKNVGTRELSDFGTLECVLLVEYVSQLSNKNLLKQNQNILGKDLYHDMVDSSFSDNSSKTPC